MRTGIGARTAMRALAAAIVAIAASGCGGATRPPDAPVPQRSYAFVPPSSASSCGEGQVMRSGAHRDPRERCARYRELTGDRPGGGGPATIAELDALAALCHDGVLDACDLGLLVVGMCSEREVPADAVCVHLARHGALYAPEPTWRDVELPPDLRGCFELVAASAGPHARLFAPGAVVCLHQEPQAVAPGSAVGSSPAPPFTTTLSVRTPDGARDALRVRALGQRRVQRIGVDVRVLPMAEVELVPPEPTSTTVGAGEIAIIMATLVRGAPPRVRTAYAELVARPLDAAGLERLAPGLDRLPLEATCARARACIERADQDQVARAEAEGTGWDGPPPELPTTFQACQAVVEDCAAP